MIYSVYFVHPSVFGCICLIDTDVLPAPSDPKVRAEANGQHLEGASQPHPAELRGLKMCLQVQKMTKAIT